MSKNRTISGCRIVDRCAVVGHAMVLSPICPSVYVCERCGIQEVTHPDRNPESELRTSIRLIATRCVE